MPFEGAFGLRRADLGLVGRAVVFHNFRFKLIPPALFGNHPIKSVFRTDRWFVLAKTLNVCACPSAFGNRPKQTAPPTNAASHISGARTRFGLLCITTGRYRQQRESLTVSLRAQLIVDPRLIAGLKLCSRILLDLSDD